MKLIIFLAFLFGAAYLFGNYHDFRDDIMRPWLVQVNHSRESDPQALCNLLSLDAKVTVNDNIPRHKVSMTDVDKVTACNYLFKSAPLMKPHNPPAKNGYIRDILQNVKITHEDITKREGAAEFETKEPRREMRNGILLAGNTSTKLELRRKWMGNSLWCEVNCPPDWSHGIEITRMELTRKYEVLPE